MSDQLKPCAKWSPDCQGKWDFDGRLVSISCRYWPRGGGFHLLNSETGEFLPSDDQTIAPSATASIAFNHGEPDEADGFSNYITLAKQDFGAETEVEVKAAVKEWVTGQVNELFQVLTTYFQTRNGKQ